MSRRIRTGSLYEWFVRKFHGTSYVIARRPDGPWEVMGKAQDVWESCVSGMDDIDDYIEHYFDDMSDFWDSPATLYHATKPDNLHNIRRHGLDPRDEIRGLRNRSVGNAVFTTTSLEWLMGAGYGDVILAINTPQMKADGYMPTVGPEPDVAEYEKLQAFMHMLDIEDDVILDGPENDYETVIVYGRIPPKYLSVLSSDE